MRTDLVTKRHGLPLAVRALTNLAMAFGVDAISPSYRVDPPRASLTTTAIVS
jgi:hypothetical protein